MEVIRYRCDFFLLFFRLVHVYMSACLLSSPYHECSYVESIKVSENSLQQRCPICFQVEVEVIKRDVHRIDGFVAKGASDCVY